jgi:Kef-type K+ transport system membrane component KefB
MANVWLASAVWLGLALLASLISIRIAISVALIEIVVGAIAGNTIGLHLTEWVNFLAGFGAILLTFLAGTEIDAQVIRKHFWSSMSIGVVGFVTILTPFYFLKAGSLVDFRAVVAAAGLILIFLAIKMVTKFVGILPLTRAFQFDPREGMYITLLMSTGLTFGTISALFGLTNHIIDQRQYTILVTAVIGSAVVPTLIAQRWFQPTFKPIAGAEVPPQPNAKEA